MQPIVQPFFDPVTGTVTYVVFQSGRQECAVIDPVLDYDPKAGRTATTNADRVIEFVRQRGLHVQWILETHAHADHLSAAYYLRDQLGGKIAIGGHIRTVQGVFKKLFNLEPEFRLDGSQFDHLFRENETFSIGALTARALCVPGHTPADTAYQIGDVVFVGDTLFMPDVGTARCDFPGGNAHTLYGSIRKLLDLPGDTRLFMCHDYPPKGREPEWETTVLAQRAHNIHVHDGVTEEQFVSMREARDATLAMPVLILPSVQVNIRGRRFASCRRERHPLPEDSLKRTLIQTTNCSECIESAGWDRCGTRQSMRRRDVVRTINSLKRPSFLVFSLKTS